MVKGVLPEGSNGGGPPEEPPDDDQDNRVMTEFAGVKKLRRERGLEDVTYPSWPHSQVKSIVLFRSGKMGLRGRALQPLGRRRLEVQVANQFASLKIGFPGCMMKFGSQPFQQ